MDVDIPVEHSSSDNDWTSEDDALGVVAMDTNTEGVANREGEDGRDGDEKNGQDLEEDEDDKDGDENNEDETEGPGSKDAKQLDAEQEFPDNAPDQPDILEVNLPDWDLDFTPLAHTVLTGSLDSIEELLNHGADATLVVDVSHDNMIHPLSLVILCENEDESCDVLAKLIFAGTSTSMADKNLRIIFHHAVVIDKVKLVSTILKCDPNADTVLKFPLVEWNKVIYPIVSAINMRHYSMLATLLAHGSKLVFTEDD
ncbi:hypothetical protein H0H87_005248, partial [Tephrocybe sp. NHM501043]